MNRKQFLTLFIVALVLAALVYLQVREWRRFDWIKFKEGTEGISLLGIFAGIACVHLADFLRAIRWKIFLRPTRPDVPWTSLIAPQFVGFAGLAFLGRPGELVRPFLIAKKSNTTVPSQLAIWFVERAFDIGAVALFLAIDLFVVPQVRREYSELRLFGYILLLLFFGFVGLLYALWKRGPQISAWICFKMTRYSKTFANSLEHKLRAASSGLHALHDLRSFAQASLISVAIWLLVVLAYRQVMHAFNPATGLPDFGFPEAILLMGASVAGGVMQLPIVGGGSQLATIAILSRSFSYNDRPEIAVAAGIMFWLVTFISVAPLGLVLARFEHLSIRELSKESETEAAAEDCPTDGVSAPSKLPS